MTIAFFIAGLALLVAGADLLVRGASKLAAALGIPSLVIGLTIVAYGTSAPELAVSIQSSLSGQTDLMLGNVVGSNIFNIVAVLGVSSVVAPAGIPVSGAALAFDIPVMLAVMVACLPIFFTGYMIARWEGALFLGYYCAYTVYLILNSTQHAALPIFNSVMLLFVIPLTVVTLLVLALRALRQQQGTFPAE